jgi:hypothetical protein
MTEHTVYVAEAKARMLDASGDDRGARVIRMSLHADELAKIGSVRVGHGGGGEKGCDAPVAYSCTHWKGDWAERWCVSCRSSYKCRDGGPGYFVGEAAAIKWLIEQEAIRDEWRRA